MGLMLMLTLAAGAAMSAGEVEARQFVPSRLLVANTVLTLNQGTNEFANVSGDPITLATVTVRLTGGDNRPGTGSRDCQPRLQVLPGTTCVIEISNIS